MNKVFADTSFWVAAIDPHDQWHPRAVTERSNLRQSMIVTTDEVLLAFLNMFCEKGQWFREMATRFVRRTMDTAGVIVYPQTRDSLLAGLKFYESRRDKEYSLTDCISMVVMRREGIQEVLTTDHHFEQEQLICLLK